MKKTGRYYIGRIHKAGLLTSELVLDAIMSPVTIQRGKYNWTIVDVVEGAVSDHTYVAGNLAKFDGEGAVPVIDDKRKVEATIDAPGLVCAKSPFVFFDSFSGFVYLHVWNSIEEDTFRRRMAELICSKYDDFFVDCAIDPISDLRTFAMRVAEMSRITEISATVHPPNPLFGVFWGPLKDYLSNRQAESLSVKEEGDKNSLGLRTNVPQIVDLLGAPHDRVNDRLVPETTMVDAALLMATDGYGKGKVVGVDEKGKSISVHTSETQKSFLHLKKPNMNDLASVALEELMKISLERDMHHA